MVVNNGNQTSPYNRFVIRVNNETVTEGYHADPG